MINPGAILWKFRVDVRPVTSSSNPNLYGRLGSTPAVVQGRVYVGGDEYLYALDAATGAEQWRFNTPNGFVTSPAVAGDTVYFESGDSTLYAVVATTGKERWRFTDANAVRGAGAIFTDPVVSDGVVYVGSVEERVYALNAFSGRELWHVAVAGSVVDTPAVADGRIYFGTAPAPPPGPTATFFYAVDARTGAIVWRVPLDSEPSSPPAVVNGVVYVTGVSLGVYALDAQTGQTKWHYNIGIGDAPAVAYNTVYINDGYGLIALDAGSGNERWRFQQPDGFSVSPTIAGDVIYCPTMDWYNNARVSQPGRLYAVNAQTGQLIRRFPIAGDLWDTTAIVDGVAYLKSSDGYLYAIR